MTTGRNPAISVKYLAMWTPRPLLLGWCLLLQQMVATAPPPPSSGWQTVLLNHGGRRELSIRVPPIYCGINLDRYGSVAPLKLNFLDAKQPMDANVAQILPPDRLSPARIFRLSEHPDLSWFLPCTRGEQVPTGSSVLQNKGNFIARHISTIWSSLLSTLSAQVVGRMLMSRFPPIKLP